MHAIGDQDGHRARILRENPGVFFVASGLAGSAELKLNEIAAYRGQYLTGDLRCRDFAQQLFEQVYSRRPVRIHAAHSGRLQGLLTWWEMTGSHDVAALNISLRS